MENSPTRVAILGAGIGALTTAYELSKQKTAGGSAAYDITLYQLGWRVGGKLATGRNAERGQRIEEHGIHGFMGSYFNAAGMMAEVFAALDELGAEHVFTQFDDAFDAQNSAIWWEYINHRWQPWLQNLPPNERSYTHASVPNHLDPRTAFGLEGAARNKLKLLSAGNDLHKLIEAGGTSTSSTAQVSSLHDLIEKLLNEVREWLAEGGKVPAILHEGPAFATLLRAAWHAVRPAEALWADLPDKLRHDLIEADFLCTILTGFLQDEIAFKGYCAIDEIDYSDWLQQHGATDATRWSPVALNTPAITYNFPRGDMTTGPKMSAGAYLQWTFGLQGYIGSFVLAFTSGSGESVLAPIYTLLKQRGVKFEFFHKVTNLALSDDKQSIASVDFDIQAKVKEGKTYDPLTDPIKGLRCWPTKPNYDQLENADEITGLNLESAWEDYKVEVKTLEAGRDFDELVLGISIGAAQYIGRELIADEGNKPTCNSPYKSRWQAMVESIETVPTQAMQLWFNEPVSAFTPQDVKFEYASDTWISGTYVLPISGQADFGKLLPKESWGASGPKGLLYVCGPMTDMAPANDTFSNKAFPAEQHLRVRAQCIQYLEASSGPFLPGASTAQQQTPTTMASLDFNRLYCPDNWQPGDEQGEGSLTGEDRFEYQFWRANIDPTERYVTCQPGTAKYRLQAWESGYRNLTLTGDWIFTGLNIGSVEGAVMGGKLASHAISGVPALASITGYNPFGVPDVKPVGE